MVFTVKPLICKMYTYFSRRRALLFKGLLLVGTVWLTVTVLVLMENQEKTLGIGEHERQGPPRQLPLVDYPNNDVGGTQSNDNNNVVEQEDPLAPAYSNAQENIAAGDELVMKKGVKLYGEYGKPVVLPTNLTSDVKKLVNEGWQKNAFNQYVSDLISLHRKLPDPRDEW